MADCCCSPFGPPTPPSSPVTSVFGRTGAVVAVAGDYTSDLITNASGVPGATVSDALNNLGTALAGFVPSSRAIATTSPLRIDGGASADLSANRTLSVLAVGNANAGVAPQHAGAADVGKALVATATASAWSAVVPATRTLTGTSPIQIDGVNTPLDLSANRTVSVLAVGNANAGVAPQHAGAADVGKALIATATASAWGTDFGTRDLTTTGAINLGTTPATAGNVRLPATYSIQHGASNLNAISGTAGTLALGSTSVQVTVTSANTTTFALTGGGTLNFNALSGQQLLFNSTAATTFGMTSTAATPGFLFTIRGHDSSAVGGTAGAVLLRAGNATGASGTRTGGNCDVQAGSGLTTGGLVRLLNGAGTVRVSANDTGLGLYTAAPVAQAARVGQAVDSTTGTPSGTRTFVDVTTTAVADPVKINNNFATLVANMWNPLELAIHNLGATA